MPGCSTGEEAYSLAISLAEFLDDKSEAPPVQIFGTDVSDQVIARARKGIFGENIEAEVSPARLKRFFTKAERGWQIKKTIRDTCVFAQQNVVKDPPFSKLDLVSCRNVLIYFEQAQQRKLIPMFHYALRVGGFLLLGSAESISAHQDLFECADAKSRIFIKRGAGAQEHHPAVELPPRRKEAAPPGDGAKEVWSRLDVQKEADRMLMARFCPPAILIGENMEIIQFRGRVAPFIEPASGNASLNLFKMLRPAIEIELRAAIARAKKTGSLTRKENIRMDSNGESKVVNLEVIPLGSPVLRERCFTVLFEELPPAAPAAPRTARGAQASTAETAQLEQELAASREQLQSVIEEHEATNEELRSANEEIQSSNEELQSTNEELETAKEELQSTNEELTTVNEELKHSNADLGSLNDDLTNLLRAVNIPIVMLDRNLRIRRFTPIARKKLKLLPADVGRAITEVRGEIELPNLEKLVLDAIESLATREMEVRDHEGRWYCLQARPYQTSDNKITGAVMILFDIDAAKRSLLQSDLAAAYADAFLETVRNALLVLDGTLRVRRATDFFYKTFRVTPQKTEGRRLYELGNGQWNIPELRTLLEEVLSRKTSVHDFEVEHEFPQIGRKRMLLNARRIERDIHGEQLILLSIEEVRTENSKMNRLPA